MSWAGVQWLCPPAPPVSPLLPVQSPAFCGGRMGWLLGSMARITPSFRCIKHVAIQNRPYGCMLMTTGCVSGSELLGWWPGTRLSFPLTMFPRVVACVRPIPEQEREKNAILFYCWICYTHYRQLTLGAILLFRINLFLCTGILILGHNHIALIYICLFFPSLLQNPE